MWEQKSKQVSDYFKITKDKKQQQQRRKSKSVSESNNRDCGENSGVEKPNNKSPVAVRKNKNNNKVVMNGEISAKTDGKSDRSKVEV